MLIQKWLIYENDTSSIVLSGWKRLEELVFRMAVTAKPIFSSICQAQLDEKWKIVPSLASNVVEFKFNTMIVSNAHWSIFTILYFNLLFLSPQPQKMMRSYFVEIMFLQQVVDLTYLLGQNTFLKIVWSHISLKNCCVKHVFYNCLSVN